MHTVPRLYEIFQPTHYTLDIHLEAADKRVFNGVASVTGISKKDGDLRLHCKELEISQVSVDHEDCDFTVDNDELIIRHDSIKKEKAFTFDVIYRGKITDSMHGLYPCYYEHDGIKKELFATQFESHHAREVFPCVDEPEAKATFDLTLFTKPGVDVLSNMPIKSQDPSGDDVCTIFETSPRMSAYLLAFVAGELHKQTAKTKNGVEVNVWATKAQPAESLTFALEVAVGSIDFFDEYFGVPYPLPKADHVALPDFSSGAMENWGLITYREAALLVDVSSAVSYRQYVATVIAHETSHQWFGNLVTMKWWDDLWLNESFATIMEYVAVDAHYPDWQIWNMFASMESLSALRRDQLAGVQAVKTAVKHPDEISTLFDSAIVYAKGGRLLKMLRSYIGETAFRDGLRAYFKEHAYQNTIGADLWRAFSKSSGKDIDSFMNTWISQPGFPLVSVTTTETGYKFSQERFVLGVASDASMWPIPLFSAHEAFPDLLDKRTIVITATHALPFLNRNNDAHFIAQYDEPAWRFILEALQRGGIGPIDRLALLHETALLARGGKTATTTLLPLLETYENEESEPVWNIISMVVGDLKRFVEEDEQSESYLKTFVASLANKQYARLGFSSLANESDEDTKLRATILGLLAYAEHDDALARCLTVFRETDDLGKLPSEIRGVILSVAAKHGTIADFDRILQLHDTTSSAELRSDASSGLSSTRDPHQISKLLDRLKDNDLIKRQDLFRWYINLLRNRHARTETWQWMTANWNWIEETFEGDKSYDNFPRYSASVFSTRKWHETYQAFFAPLKNQTALARAIEVGMIEITSRVDWLERDTPALVAALEQRGDTIKQL